MLLLEQQFFTFILCLHVIDFYQECKAPVRVYVNSKVEIHDWFTITVLRSISHYSQSQFSFCNTNLSDDKLFVFIYRVALCLIFIV